MAHNIDMTNGRANIAFLGSRDDVWHKLGQEMKEGMSVEDWAKAAGLDWHAVKAAAYVHLPEGIAGGTAFDVKTGITESGYMRLAMVDGVRHIVRSDNGHVLGTATDRYQPHQPAELLDWFKQYISVDERFQIDVAGSLKQGEIIWATATFNGGMDVAGDKHVARLLMTTTFDATGATINKGTVTRVVCNNTLDAALGSDKRAVVKTRHNTRFDAVRVGKELACIAQGFDQYKAMGDAMAKQHVSREQVSKFFKTVLEIPFDAEKKDISTRKLNQFQELGQAYAATVREGTEPETMWAALNAVTRYVDHDRSTRGGGSTGSPGEGRFLSAQFGSGAAMKEKAVATLFEMSDGELLKAVWAKTADDADLSAILKQPLRSSVGA
jgi:phage/plasmid-like protein (TIGR03299 family)